MRFEKGNMVEVYGIDGVSKFRGEVVTADEHHFTVHGDGWSETFTQDTDQVILFSDG
jgi:hypothetical protein